MGDYNMISEAKARADAKYQKKTFDIINAKVRKDTGDKQKFTDYADSLDMSLSQLIIKALHYVVDNKIKL